MSFVTASLIFTVFFLILNISNVVLSYKNEIYYNLALFGSANDDIGEKCRTELSEIVKSIDERQIWGLKSELNYFFSCEENNL